MEKSINIRIVLCLAILLINSTNLQSMEKKTAQNCAQHEQLVLQEGKYDCSCVFLPDDILKIIFDYCYTYDDDHIKSIENNIKNFIRLSATCKNFSKRLTFETIGGLSKNYPLSDKNKILEKLTTYLHGVNHRLPTLILICAGADAYVSNIWLFRGGVRINDIEAVTTSLKYYAHPNRIEWQNSILFSAKSAEMAQILIAHGADIQVTYCSPYSRLIENATRNLLWEVVKPWCTSELLALYLKYKVDARLDCWGNRILHKLVYENRNMQGTGIDEFLEKSELLFGVIPDMINTLNADNETPLDMLKSRLNFYSDKSEDAKRPFRTAIAFFRSYGAKTAKELVK